MKKFALISMAALAVVSVKAATVDWTSGDLSDIATSEIKSVTAYYYVLDESAYATMSGMSSEQIVNNYLDSKTGNLKTAASQEVEMDAFGYADWSQDTDADPAYVAVVYKFSTFNGGAYAIGATGSYSEGTGGMPGYNDPSLDLSGEMGTTAFENASRQWTAVPEPTTVALLALGLAAVGLKRKVA